jgi:hypothetical protein
MEETMNTLPDDFEEREKTFFFSEATKAALDKAYDDSLPKVYEDLDLDHERFATDDCHLCGTPKEKHCSFPWQKCSPGPEICCTCQLSVNEYLEGPDWADWRDGR